MTSLHEIGWFAVEDSSAPGSVRRAAVALAMRLGFDEHRTGQVAIATTELATNLFRHAVGGTVMLRVRRWQNDASVELVASDSGPGMTDIANSARDGHSTGGTLGIGLGAIMRLATWIDIHSVIGRGTVIAATFEREASRTERSAIALITRPMSGEDVCGDASAYRISGETTTLLSVDGLGHGKLAAVAAQAAVHSFMDGDIEREPAAVLADINRALRGTRGAAAAVLRIERGSEAAIFAGLGNVATWIDDGERRQSLLSSPGIAGSHTRIIRQVSSALPKSALVAMHSDGLTSKWTFDRYPGIRTRDPIVIAATLMRDAGVHRDDASILVARAS